MTQFSNRKIAGLVIAPNFRDEEYFTPKRILEEAGIQTQTISLEKGLVVGADGGEANADLEIGERKAENFRAVLFIGGPGMAKNLDNQELQKLAKDTVQADKILGAICIAPALLAKAGVLQGKRATVWSSPLDKSAVKILEQKGAVYENQPVVVDGKIITANGPSSAEQFSKTIIETLK